MWRRKFVSVVGGLVLLLPVVSAKAQEDIEIPPPISTAPQLLITELQANGLTADQEFIELYNTGSSVIDLATIKLQRATAAAKTEELWTNLSMVAPLVGDLLPGEFLVIGHEDYLDLNTTVRFGGSNLSNSGGHLRIVWDDPLTDEEIEKFELDKIGWGTAEMPEGLPAVAAKAGFSLQRCLLETGEFDDTNDNSVDFKEFEEPTAGEVTGDCSPPVQVPEPSEDDEGSDSEPTESEDGEEESEPVIEQERLLPIVITELLPNPASPQTDADDEYVELFNPNNSDLILDGWRLETGSSFSYRVFLDGLLIPANGYLVITSADTSLTLSNSSGAARLMNNQSEVESQAEPYEDADDGSAWALVAGAWQWTTTPSYGLPNILTLPAAPAVKAAKTTAKKPAKKATTTKKTSTKSSAKATKASAARDIFEAPLSDDQLLPINPTVLAAVGLAALGYTLYEYRYDARNRLEQFRRHREIRRAARAKT